MLTRRIGNGLKKLATLIVQSGSLVGSLALKFNKGERITSNLDGQSTVLERFPGDNVYSLITGGTFKVANIVRGSYGFRPGNDPARQSFVHGRTPADSFYYELEVQSQESLYNNREKRYEPVGSTVIVPKRVVENLFISTPTLKLYVEEEEDKLAG